MKSNLSKKLFSIFSIAIIITNCSSSTKSRELASDDSCITPTLACAVGYTCVPSAAISITTIPDSVNLFDASVGYIVTEQSNSRFQFLSEAPLPDSGYDIGNFSVWRDKNKDLVLDKGEIEPLRNQANNSINIIPPTLGSKPSVLTKSTFYQRDRFGNEIAGLFSRDGKPIEDSLENHKGEVVFLNYMGEEYCPSGLKANDTNTTTP